MKNETTKPCSRLVIVMEGDMIQSIISDNPESAPEIAIVDYDTYGCESGELRDITQGDGSQSLAHVTERYVEEADIDLDSVFLKQETMT
ncbi:hypothetical protein [Thiolapillus sp.]|uniref:hypothetical protein n=1 Tax=Thiolapillus sp. TaxID=2017437 RepID=UPI003AF92CA4